jgi:SAM-dependent methyltransferase
MRRNAGHEPFDRDVRAHAGYVYTTNGRLSSSLANERLTIASLSALSYRGLRLVDIGCGDGAYTVQLYDRGGPAFTSGIDPAQEAILAADRLKGNRKIEFIAADASCLPYADDSFDIAHLRGVLHHMEDPATAIREALRVAPVVIILEPNGYNPILKWLEKHSQYHIAHGEKSYPPRRLIGWSKAATAVPLRHDWVGLVPFFCPDLAARILKRIEPLVERLPLLNRLTCAVFVLVVERVQIAEMPLHRKASDR